MFIFKLLSVVLSIYSLLCIIRILLTWIPSLSYSRFGKVVAELTDPYLSLFSKFRFMRFGAVDFSPILAIALIGLLSSICDVFARFDRFAIGTLLAAIISVCWGACSVILTFLSIIVIIRLVFTLLNKSTATLAWQKLDSFIAPAKDWVNATFFKNRFVNYTTTLIVILVCVILLNSVGGFLINWICKFFARLPF